SLEGPRHSVDVRSGAVVVGDEVGVRAELGVRGGEEDGPSVQLELRLLEDEGRVERLSAPDRLDRSEGGLDLRLQGDPRGVAATEREDVDAHGLFTGGTPPCPRGTGAAPTQVEGDDVVGHAAQRKRGDEDG